MFIRLAFPWLGHHGRPFTIHTEDTFALGGWEVHIISPTHARQINRLGAKADGDFKFTQTACIPPLSAYTLG